MSVILICSSKTSEVMLNIDGALTSFTQLFKKIYHFNVDVNVKICQDKAVKLNLTDIVTSRVLSQWA
jgi:hypothetical protein